MEIPFHPLLVNFTAGLVPASFALDALGAALKNSSLRAAAWWTLLLGAAATPLTAAAGYLWLQSKGDMHHWQMPYHMWLGIAIAVLLIGLAAWRGWLRYRADRPPGWAYAVAAVVLLGGLVVQGELGSSMSFGRGIVLTPAPDAQHIHSGSDGTGHGSGGSSGGGGTTGHRHGSNAPSSTGPTPASHAGEQSSEERRATEHPH